MEAKVKWQGRLSFTGRAGSGFEIPLGTSPSVGGDNDGLRPMELIAIGLAGCTAMDVISILKKKQQKVTAFEVRVNANQDCEHPKVFMQAMIEYIVSGHGLDPAAVNRAVELSLTKYCPVHRMLSKAFPIGYSIQIVEAKEEQKPEG